MTTQPHAPWRTLPAHPNLEQLRKQAKDLLRDYLANDPAAIAEVTRAERSSKADFRLTDAQRVLARAYGFASWMKLKEKVEGIHIGEFSDAAARGDVPRLKHLLARNPQLIRMEMSGADERTALHHAVLNRQPQAVQFLMSAGADARKGVYPSRDATSPLVIARDRGYDEIVNIIEEAEQHRREDASCPNATVSPEQEQLNAAIRAGRMDDAIAQLSADESLIKACDRDGGSPLHVASEAGDKKLVEWLLARRASVTRTDAAGRTPLDRAAYSVDPRHEGSIQRFKRVASVLRAAGAPFTLPVAVALGDTERVLQLHREEPNLFQPSGTFTPGPLGLAVRHRQHVMMRVLLDLGVDPDERRRVDGLEDEEYSSGDPLWHAVQGGDLEATTLLLDRGADPNANLYASGTPTTTAFGMRNQRMQDLMLARGGRLMSTSIGLYRRTDHARDLLAGRDLDTIVPDLSGGLTLPEQLLWGGACGGDPEIVRLALEHIDWSRDNPRWFNMAVQPMRIWNHGPGFWARNEWPRTYVDCFRLVLARMDPNIRGRSGQTLLHRVASDGSTRGKEVMTTQERTEFATLLLDAGARFDARDELLASTPLGWAARWGRLELVDLYLAHGCPRTEPDAESWATPLAWAKRYRHQAITSRLE